MTEPTKLKISLAQQLEEIDLCIKDVNAWPYKRRDSSEFRLRVDRLAACRRSLAFIAEHKDEYLAFVEKKGDTGQLREPLVVSPAPRTERTI
jgi:hypothetical protein